MRPLTVLQTLAVSFMESSSWSETVALYDRLIGALVEGDLLELKVEVVRLGVTVEIDRFGVMIPADLVVAWTVTWNEDNQYKRLQKNGYFSKSLFLHYNSLFLKCRPSAHNYIVITWQDRCAQFNIIGVNIFGTLHEL